MESRTTKQSRFGISFRTSVISGLTVFILLLISSEKQAKNQKAQLSESMKVNAEICGGIASNFLYNFDEEGLAKALSPYMKLPSIRAIRVVDNKKKSFLAIWKAPEIRSGYYHQSVSSGYCR